MGKPPKALGEVSLPGWLTPTVVEDLRSRLLAWYGKQGRALPWRQTRDPYAIWISEVMLQQTQAQTVIPYYQRWLTLFPTVSDLAQAELQTVLKAWEGLGYYARARHLHQAAQILCQDHQGQFPQGLAAAIALPGIGRTTAGGILSAAFDQGVPILDGNVKRVLARLVALDRPPNQDLPSLWAISTALVPPQGRDFNQGIMDLGATCCRRHQPDCPHCPWQPHCRAHHQNRQHQLPMTIPRDPLPHKHIGVGVIWNDQGQVLIDRRPAEGLLGGLWEFPGGKIEPGETPSECIRRELQEELGITVTVGEALMTLDHAYTHFKVTLHIHHCHHPQGEPQPLACDEIRWVSLGELIDYPFPKANLQIIQALQALPHPPQAP